MKVFSGQVGHSVATATSDAFSLSADAHSLASDAVDSGAHLVSRVPVADAGIVASAPAVSGAGFPG